MFVFKALIKNECFKAVLGGLQSCVIGVIAATGVYMTYKNVFFSKSSGIFAFDSKTALFTLALIILYIAARKLMKKGFSPIYFIIASAAAGMLVYA